jgi:hypothetical protein
MPIDDQDHDRFEHSDRNLNLDHHPLSTPCDLTELSALTNQPTQPTNMSEYTHPSGRDNNGPPPDPDRNTPMSSRAATLAGTDESRPPSGTERFKARVDRAEERIQRMGRDVKKGFKSFLGISKPKNPREGESSAQGGAHAEGGAGAGTTSADDDTGATSGQGGAEATSAPEDDADATSAPKDNAGATTAPEDDAGVTGAPKDNAGATSAPKDNAGATNAPEDNAGATTATEDNAGATSAPKDNAGATNAPKDDAGATSSPKHNPGATSVPEGNTGATNTQDGANTKGSGKGWAIAKGTFKTVLGIAVTFVPETFKGPVEALLKVMDVIEVFLYFLSIDCASY